MVGATLASALAPLGLRILILDKHPPVIQAPSEGFSPRVSAISPASQKVWTTLGIWPLILKSHRFQPYTGMDVWDSAGNGSIHFDSAELKRPALGTIIENHVIQSALMEQLSTFDNVTVHAPVSLKALSQTSTAISLTLENGNSFSCHLLVGADGALSWVRQEAHFGFDEKSYDHHALVTTVYSERPHHNIARQCFTPEGPLAFLPLCDPHACSIVWSTSVAFNQHLMSIDDAALQLLLAKNIDHKLGTIQKADPRFSFPLLMRHAKTYVKPHIALVGDAAHTLHPLAGQGVNLGLLDAFSLANTIKEAVSKRYDYADLLTLNHYQRARRSHNRLMIASMQVFKSLFSRQDLLTTVARNIGLSVCNRFTPLKHSLIFFAMGLSEV